MTKDIKYTKNFKKRFKKKQHDPEWRVVFKKSLPQSLDTQERSPWEFIIHCLIENKKIPEYFYPHSLEGLKDLKKQIKHQLNDSKMTVVILELHFDGHSGDRLLVYVSTKEKVFLVGIGTHSELFG